MSEVCHHTRRKPRYLQRLAAEMTFEDMADALGWTVEEVKASDPSGQWRPD